MPLDCVLRHPLLPTERGNHFLGKFVTHNGALNTRRTTAALRQVFEHRSCFRAMGVRCPSGMPRHHCAASLSAGPSLSGPVRRRWPPFCFAHRRGTHSAQRPDPGPLHSHSSKHRCGEHDRLIPFWRHTYVCRHSCTRGWLGWDRVPHFRDYSTTQARIDVFKSFEHDPCEVTDILGTASHSRC